jgi:hypothetical protein
MQHQVKWEYKMMGEKQFDIIGSVFVDYSWTDHSGIEVEEGRKVYNYINSGVNDFDLC